MGKLEKQTLKRPALGARSEAERPNPEGANWALLLYRTFHSFITRLQKFFDKRA